MICTVCSTENPSGAMFCMGCGNALQQSCASCGADLPAGAGFCPSCGTKVGDVAAAPAPAPSAPATGAFEHLIAPVYRHEGSLARLMGDAVLAFFGAPIGHEDDPERAVRAGLEIVDAIEPYRVQVKHEWGIDIDVRVGINTAEQILTELEEYVAERAMNDVRPAVLFTAAAVAASADDHATALLRLAECRDLANEASMRIMLLDVHAATARSLRASGRRDEAGAAETAA
jgi:hypothetical protein